MRGLIGGIAAGAVTAVLGAAAVSVLAPLPTPMAPRVVPEVGPEAGPEAGSVAEVGAQDAGAVAAVDAPPAEGTAPAIGTIPEGSEFDSAGSVRAPQLGQPVGAPVATGVAPPVSLPESTEPEPAMAGTTPPARPEAAAEVAAPQAAPEAAQAALDATPEPEAPVPVPPPGEVETPALAPAAPEGAGTDLPVAAAAPGGPEPRVPAGTAPATLTPETAVPEAAPARTAPAETAEPGGEAREAGDRIAVLPAEPGPTGAGTAAPDLPRVIPPPSTPDSGPEIVLLPDGSPVSPGTPDLPRVFRPDGQSAPQLSGAPVPGFADASGVRVNRLPTIGAPDPTAPTASGEGGAITAPDATAEAPPLRRYASAFAAPAETALLSVVLVDVGTAAGGLDPVTLKTLGLPVTVALDPGQADVAARAAEYRAAGLEVAILAQPLPAGATPADLEVALEAWHRAVPEAVALVEPGQPLIQNNRGLAQQLTKALAREGLGLITQDQGLNAAAQIAGAEGLPEAEVWRVIDGGREDAPVVERMLGRAGFEASRDGRLVVMLTSWPQSVAGLVAWAAGAPRGVTLAPVTAQMQDGAF